MPNYCYNTLEVHADDEIITQIHKYIRSSVSDFDFKKVLPIPAEEKDNRYHWCCENWGTKWNAMEVEADFGIITFSTAWTPCFPVIAKLAELFPKAEFWFQYEECGCCFAGAQLYRYGELVYELTGDYYSNPLWEDESEEAEGYIVKDDLFPIQESGTLEHTEFEGSTDGFIYENAYIREYGNGKIKYKIDGKIKYKGERPSFLY